MDHILLNLSSSGSAAAVTRSGDYCPGRGVHPHPRPPSASGRWRNYLKKAGARIDRVREPEELGCGELLVLVACVHVCQAMCTNWYSTALLAVLGNVLSG